MIEVVRLSCGDKHIGVAIDPAAVYRADDRAAWIAEHGATAWLALFAACGWTEPASAAMRRIIEEDAGKSPPDQISLIEARAAELEAKGM